MKIPQYLLNNCKLHCKAPRLNAFTSSSSRLLSSFLPVRHLSFSMAHWRSLLLFLSSVSWSFSASTSAAFCDTSDLLTEKISVSWEVMDVCFFYCSCVEHFSVCWSFELKSCNWRQTFTDAKVTMIKGLRKEVISCDILNNFTSSGQLTWFDS